jgi:hypothetical protein
VLREVAHPQAALEGHAGVAYLARYLETVGVSALVVERDYTDGDYLSDFAHYYVRAFEELPRRCVRLHFFASPVSGAPVDEASLLEALQRPDGPPPDLVEAYRGFIVVRPLPDAPIGRTVLATYPSAGGRRHYTAVRRYTAHLYGAAFPVDSLAFQEQDQVVAACATVALWSALHKTADLFGTPMLSPSAITELATSGGTEGRPLPARGLKVGQLCRAVSAVRLEPEVVTCASNVPLLSLLHAYLAFGLPVILFVEVADALKAAGEPVQGHAVTVTGFSLHATPVVAREDLVTPTSPVSRVGLRIDEFYAHDDQVGPFARLRVVPHTGPTGEAGLDEPCIAFEEDWPHAGGITTRRLIPRRVIVPVYHKVRLPFLDLQGVLTALAVAAEAVIGALGGLEWDVRLMSGTDAKRAVREMGRDPAVDPAVVRHVLFAPLPRFVWRASLQQIGTPGRPVADLLFDATGVARAAPVLDVLYFDAAFQQAMAAALHSDALEDVLRDVLRPALYEVMRQRTPAPRG